MKQGIAEKDQEGFVMEWNLLYSNGKPTLKQVADYVDSPLWTEFNSRIQTCYKIEPIMEYSRCSMQRGWNIKYKKSGKSLCTLYPMSNYFIVLVVIGDKEMQEADFLIQRCSGYVQDVFNNTKTGQGQKWLMIEVRDKKTMDDVFTLIHLRKRP